MMRDALRLPCAQCGAALALPEPSPIDVGPIVARCAWCGAEEELPSEPAQRTRALQIRRAQRAWADAASSGIATALMPLATTRGALGLVAPTALVVVALGILRGGLGAALPIAGALLGLALASWKIARETRRVLGPLIGALPPAGPSSPARCRGCGAPLTFERATVRCPGCATTNLAPALVARALADTGDLAARHRETARRRARVEGLTRWMGLTWTAGLLGGAALGGALMCLWS